MDAAVIERIVTSAGRGASALFAAAMAYAAYGFLLAVGVSPEVGVCAASAGSLAYLPCSRLLGAAGSVSPGFDLPAFELRDLEFSDAMDELLLTDAIRPGSPGELILTDADRLDGSEPLLLDDILAKIDAGTRVVRLFDR